MEMYVNGGLEVEKPRSIRGPRKTWMERVENNVKCMDWVVHT